MNKLFLIQDRHENPLKIEHDILTNEIHQTYGDRYNRFEYIHLVLQEFIDEDMGKPCNYPKYFSSAVPVGSIEFISAWLKIFYGVTPNPIEMPKCLLKQEFLKREYRVVPFNEIPREGAYFVKDVSALKSFNTGMVSDLSQIDFDLISSDDYEPNDQFDSEKIDKTHLFQVSQRVDVLSEYRVYFIDGKLINICNYNGDIACQPDVSLIQKANIIYSFDKAYPKSYTMDVMVTKDGTSIVEIHPFASVGLYSTLWGRQLLFAYMDGINYYINHNVAIEPLIAQ